MANMNRRLNSIEKKLRPGNESRIDPPIIISQSGINPTAEDEQKLGPYETWLTYNEQLQAAREANAEHLRNNPGCLPQAIVIELGVEKEYQARRMVGSKRE